MSAGTARVTRGVCGDAVAAQGGLALVAAADPTLRRRVRRGLYLLDVASGRRLRFIRAASPLAVAL
jgi:hypothetical protein